MISLTTTLSFLSLLGLASASSSFSSLLVSTGFLSSSDVFLLSSTTTLESILFNSSRISWSLLSMSLISSSISSLVIRTVSESSFSSSFSSSISISIDGTGKIGLAFSSIIAQSVDSFPLHLWYHQFRLI